MLTYESKVSNALSEYQLPTYETDDTKIDEISDYNDAPNQKIAQYNRLIWL